MSVLSLQSRFSSAHLYHQPLWGEEKNHEVFGRCHTRYGHGHNYVLEVGFVLLDPDLSGHAITKQRILDLLTRQLDHEHLNFTIPEFKEKIPTSENICLYFLEKLRQENISYVRVYETNDLWAQIETGLNR